MTGRVVPEEDAHIVAWVPAYLVFSTLFSARLGWPGSGQGDTHRTGQLDPFLLAAAFIP
jgi:hypothetical protein